MNEGRVITTAKIIGVSEPDKMITEEILECPQCGYTEVNEFDPPRNPYKLLPPKKCPNKCKIGEIAQFDRPNNDPDGGPPGSGDSTVLKLVERSMLDKEGNNKGYFTLDDLVFTMQMLPNKRWTENEIEQTLYALLEEGKVQETGQPGRYRPVI